MSPSVSDGVQGGRRPSYKDRASMRGPCTPSSLPNTSTPPEAGYSVNVRTRRFTHRTRACARVRCSTRASTRGQWNGILSVTGRRLGWLVAARYGPRRGVRTRESTRTQRLVTAAEGGGSSTLLLSARAEAWYPWSGLSSTFTRSRRMRRRTAASGRRRRPRPTG